MIVEDLIKVLGKAPKDAVVKLSDGFSCKILEEKAVEVHTDQKIVFIEIKK